MVLPTDKLGKPPTQEGIITLKPQRPKVIPRPEAKRRQGTIKNTNFKVGPSGLVDFKPGPKG